MQDVQSAQVVGRPREDVWIGRRGRREELQETISQFFHRLGKESRAAIRTSKGGITRAPVTTDDAHEGLSTRQAIYSPLLGPDRKLKWHNSRGMHCQPMRGVKGDLLARVGSFPFISGYRWCCRVF